MTPVCITLLISAGALVQLFDLGQALTVDDREIHIDKEQLRQYLEDFFSKERNDDRIEEKRRVRQSIMTHFEEIRSHLPGDLTDRLEIKKHSYDLKGANIILTIKGERFNTNDDQISLIGAHYDSPRNSPGVNGNGSGMAALLAIAKLLGRAMAVKQCPVLNTIIVAAFDQQENNHTGSDHYVKHLETEILQKYQVKNFTGAFILETMMNFDTARNAQEVLPGISRIFPEQYKLLQENAFRGDFMLAVARQNDVPISNLFSEQWYQIVGGNFTSTSKYRELNFALPLSGNPQDWPDDQKTMVEDFLRSDHKSFWRLRSDYTQNGLKAVMITDTSEFRGDMKTCYRQACDDLSKVNDDKLQFLQIGAEAVLRSLTILSTGRQDMKCLSSMPDRAASMPDGVPAIPGVSFTLLFLATAAYLVA